MEDIFEKAMEADLVVRRPAAPYGGMLPGMRPDVDAVNKRRIGWKLRNGGWAKGQCGRGGRDPARFSCAHTCRARSCSSTEPAPSPEGRPSTRNQS
jgi:hypothetical protein